MHGVQQPHSFALVHYYTFMSCMHVFKRTCCKALAYVQRPCTQRDTSELVQGVAIYSKCQTPLLFRAIFHRFTGQYVTAIKNTSIRQWRKIFHQWRLQLFSIFYFWTRKGYFVPLFFIHFLILLIFLKGFYDFFAIFS